MTAMNTIFLLLSIQAALGAFDNLWHHELEARLPQRTSARYELSLHAAREAIYGVVFVGLAWFEWRGAFAAVLAALLLVELGITLADFLEEDRTRRLPPFERVLHTVLTISYGLFLGLIAPVLWAWVQQPTAMVLAPHGWVSWLFTAYAVGVWAWSVRNTLAAIKLYRTAPPAQPRALHARGLQPQPATLVTGATGFVGSALVADLVRDGQRVIVLSRDALQARASFGPGVWVVDTLDAIPPETTIDAVVNLAGARVLGMPWTAARRRQLLASRVDTTVAVVSLMRRLQKAPRVLVSASAVGFYGASPNATMEPLDETAPPRPGEFQSDLCAAIEHEARRAEALGVRVVRMRFGVVLGHGRGAYPMQALAGRLGLGTVLGHGRQPAPWVHLADAVGLVRFAMAHSYLQGPVNAVAPDAVTQATFARTLAASFGRPAWLRVPVWPLRALLREMSTLLVDGQNAVPSAALGQGYRFVHPRLSGALANLAESGRTEERLVQQE
ncbi:MULTISPECIES: TIGR01777 family oxidoreductase [unclassified Acidovorax]|uniref:TIGR01777 family oxidoreductase n=1 Tax=unclassified Acidovorax TaxID=2684926 RepID=UPI001C44183C|nr:MULTISPECIES: TIGR01777 family oxidoreductase [unclassified Acidovorax]MBV7461845.1 TIGR01777 family oxidoreductase [Acidovorax sp. sif0632]MBV7466781.1 TIGR01777 family oxidoreductase [Acidovorax sp. sif0613]